MNKKFYLTLFFFCCSLGAETDQKFEKNVEKMMIGSWLTLSISALASRSSTSLRNLIFGTKNVPQTIPSIVRPMLETASKAYFKEARSGWSLVLGNIFASDQTIFLSKQVCKYPEILQQHTNKKLLAKAFADISTDRDFKVTMGGILIPAAIFSGLTLYDKLMQKVLSKDSTFYAWHKWLFGAHGFKIKTLTSLLLFWSYIKYSDHIAAQEAAKIIFS